LSTLVKNVNPPSCVSSLQYIIMNWFFICALVLSPHQFNRVVPVLRLTKNSCAEDSTSFAPFCATVSFQKHNECWLVCPEKSP
jgi:hypothetical protein